MCRGSASYMRLRTILIFFFNDTATTEIYTLSLHDALPIWPDREKRRPRGELDRALEVEDFRGDPGARARARPDRKSTRPNSSHSQISYAVFCLKKKKKKRCPPLPLRRRAPVGR